jgi:hypothetical protein
MPSKSNFNGADIVHDAATVTLACQCRLIQKRGFLERFPMAVMLETANLALAL